MKKGTWIVFALAVVLGALYFMTRENQVSVGVKQLKLPTFTNDKADRIEILSKNPVTLVKREGGWKVLLGEGKDAREAAADSANVDSVLDAALQIRSSYYVTNLKDKQEELGFGKDTAITVKILSADKPLWVLMLGKNAQGAGRYAKLPEEDDIFVVRGSFWQLTRNGAIDFRNRDIWPIKEGELERLAIVKPDGSEVLLVKDDGENQWKFDAAQQGLPKDFRVDKSALSGLVRASMNMRASGFIDEAKELSSPSLVVKASTKDTTHVVELYPYTSDKYLAKRVGDNQVYEVTKHNFDRLNQSASAMRDLSVLRFDKTHVKEIALRHGKERVLLTKDDGQWKIVEPKKQPAKFEFDATAVEDVLSLLSGLNGERLASAKDIPQKSDWQKTWLVELTTDEGKIHLFAEKIKASKDEFLVRGNIDDEIYVVKAVRLSSLNAGINAFKKEEFDLPPIDENTKGFESLPVDIQRKLLNITKEKKEP